MTYIAVTENSMVQAAALSFVLPEAPSFQWKQGANAGVNNDDRILDDMEANVRLWASQIAVWKAQANATLREVRLKIEQFNKEHGAREAGEALDPVIGVAVERAEELLERVQIPLHHRVDFVSISRRITADRARRMRKLLKRVEDLRVEQYNTTVDLIYGIQALRFDGEIDPSDRSTSFSSADDLMAALRAELH